MRRLFLLFLIALVLCTLVSAQQGTSTPSSVVPRLIRFSGTLVDNSYKPVSGTVGVVFSIYTQQRGGAPLWSEIQNVKPDAQGKYNILLGATKADGIPMELFTSGEAQWLGVRIDGQAEQPRVLLVSVPYALKAAEAETLAGRPLSAFVLSGASSGKGVDGLTYLNPEASAKGSDATTSVTSGTANYIARFTNSTDLGNSIIYQSPTNRIGVNTTSPTAGLHAVGTGVVGGIFESYSGDSSTAPTTPFFQRSSRGTATAPVALAMHDMIGGFLAGGYNGTAITSTRAGVLARAGGAWTSTSNPTYMAFFPTNTGSTTVVEQMRILPGGYVGIGTTSPTVRLHVAGDAMITGATTFGGLVNFAGGQTFPGATVNTSAPVTGDGSVAFPLSIPLATTSTSGYLSATDWNTFNGKLAPNGNGSALTNVNALTLQGYVPSNFVTLIPYSGGESYIEPGFGYFTSYGAWPAALTGRSYATSGATQGVYGIVSSSAGVGGLFANNASTGKAISAVVNGTEIMNVADTGVNVTGNVNVTGTLNAKGVLVDSILGNISLPSASASGYKPIYLNYTPSVNVRAFVQSRCSMYGTAAGQDLAIRSAYRTPTGSGGSVTIGTAYYLDAVTNGTESVFNENNDFFDLSAGNSYDFGVNVYYTPPQGTGWCSVVVQFFSR